jgi:ankyrin repeat protein
VKYEPGDLRFRLVSARFFLEFATIPALLAGTWVYASMAASRTPAAAASDEPRPWATNAYLSSPLVGFMNRRDLGGAIGWLRERGTPLNQVDGEGITPLHIAANVGDTRAADYLIAHGADVNRPHRVWGTPLMRALLVGHYETAELLLRRGADPAVMCGDGDTPLLAAARGGHADCIRLIVARRVEVMPPGIVANPANELCASDENVDVLRALIAAGADPNGAGRNGELPAVTATIFRADKCLAVLLEAGADPDRRDAKGRSARSVATGHPELE